MQPFSFPVATFGPLQLRPLVLLLVLLAPAWGAAQETGSRTKSGSPPRTGQPAAAAPAAAPRPTAPAARAPAVDSPADPATDAPPARSPASLYPEPLVEYKGRRIAQTMHYLGAEWLIRESREREERCSLMIANLGIKPGMIVCDMGCGNGFYTVPMAKMVGDSGHVYAVDIQPEMLRMLNERMDREKVDNITPVLGTGIHPRLPDGRIDLILLVDVYHEFSYPEQMLAAMRASLSPKGTIVLVEFRGEDPQVPIKPEHKMSKEQILKELPPNGFKLVKQFDKLPWQHMMWFGRDETWTAPDSAPTPSNP